MYVKKGRRPRAFRDPALAAKAAQEWRLCHEAAKEAQAAKDRALVRMIHAGMSVHQIAQAVGVFDNSIRWQAREAGIMLPPVKRRPKRPHEVLRAPERKGSVLFGD